MDQIITIENLHYFAYCNHEICTRPIVGLVFDFRGLGDGSMHSEHTANGKLFAEKGILFVIPYYNPWAWMNRQTIDFVDELADVLFRAYDLPDDLPVVSSGGSMGGQSALVYTAYARRTPVACVANCPVCDLPFHFTERPDLPRTLYSAFGDCPGTLEAVLRTASPLHLVDRMPTSAAYYIFHCEEDSAVNIASHSNVFVEKMRSGHDLTYYTVPDRGHCDLSEEMWALYHQCIVNSIINRPASDAPRPV